jgi:hypothetical protein
MKEITLAQYVEQHKQEAAAGLLGVVQPSISKMLKAERDIRLVFDGDVFVRAYEPKIIKTNSAA